MAKKIVTWAGSGPGACRALQDAGYGPAVEPGQSFEVDADLAESLIASSDDWVAGNAAAKPKGKRSRKSAADAEQPSAEPENEPAPEPDEPEEAAE